MPTPIEQALITLVPTLNTLPQELLDLSASLLAQSRAKAATLKQDEEIGRVFACAHLAVERLKHRLDIDKVVARPPVAPRIYKKLYGYLDAALAPATPRAQRVADVGLLGSRGKRSAPGTPSKTPVASAAATPSKTPLSAARSVASSTASGRQTRSAAKPRQQFTVAKEETEQEEEQEDQEQEDHLPAQALPVITSVCDALDSPQAIPHVRAAISAILQLRGWDDLHSKKRKPSPQTSAAKRRRTSSGTEVVAPEESSQQFTPTTLPPLIVALSLLITFTLRDTIIDHAAYATARSTAISSLASQAPSGADVDTFLHTSKREGWLELPWFTAVKASATTLAPAQTPRKNKAPAKTPLRRREKHAPRPKSSELLEDEDLTMKDADEAESETVGAGLKWGLGTMFQDSIDWLSAERKANYRIWESDVRRKCDEIEAEAAATTA